MKVLFSKSVIFPVFIFLGLFFRVIFQKCYFPKVLFSYASLSKCFTRQTDIDLKLIYIWILTIEPASDCSLFGSFATGCRTPTPETADPCSRKTRHCWSQTISNFCLRLFRIAAKMFINNRFSYERFTERGSNLHTVRSACFRTACPVVKNPIVFNFLFAWLKIRTVSDQFSSIFYITKPVAITSSLESNNILKLI